MFILRALRTIVTWGWSPISITTLAIIGSLYEWPIVVLGSLMIVILVIGLVVAVVGAREREMERSALRLRQLAGYFNRRFTGNSSLSIFAIIDSLFGSENPQLWEWARACDMARRIFDTWCNSFIDRLEADTRSGRFSAFLRTYLNELWLVNSHYYEFIEQFYEITQKVEVPREAIDQYNRFVTEYNNFVTNFGDNISELRKTAKTEIESPSVKPARELSAARPLQATEEKEAKPSKPSKPPGDKGYYG